jgi:hypothetical protein
MALDVISSAKDVVDRALKSMADKIPNFSDKVSLDLGQNLGKNIPDFSEQSMFKRMLPENDGHWTGDRGNSVWVPDNDYIPKKGNPSNETWGEIKERYGIDGIEFKNGESDFTQISEGTVEIADFTTDRKLNFMQADESLANKWTEEGKDGKVWSPQDVSDYRKENSLSWHERSDQKTMDLVPSIVHGNVPHSGGISEAKKGV